MSYNTDSRRTQKQTAASTSTKFVWEPTTDAYFSQLDNANTNQMIYTFEPVQYGNLISQRTGGTWYIHADALGSTRALSTAGNTVTDTFLYDAWGIEVARTGTTAIVPFRWVGGVGYYYDTETGLVYVRARMCQPTVARWNSTDPLPFVDGLNDFAYVLDSPLLYLDPSGQGQRTLNSFDTKDLHQEVIIPAADSSFHGEAVLAGMLFQQGQSEASEPCQILGDRALASS